MCVCVCAFGACTLYTAGHDNSLFLKQHQTHKITHKPTLAGLAAQQPGPVVRMRLHIFNGEVRVSFRFPPANSLAGVPVSLGLGEFLASLHSS